MFDLPEIKPYVVEHELAARRCRCGQMTRALAPVGLAAPVQYGPRIAALAVGLWHGHFFSGAGVGNDLAEVPVVAGSELGLDDDFPAVFVLGGDVRAQPSDWNFAAYEPEVHPELLTELPKVLDEPWCEVADLVRQRLARVADDSEPHRADRPFAGESTGTTRGGRFGLAVVKSAMLRLTRSTLESSVR